MSNHPSKLEQGEDEGYLDYLTRQLAAWTDTPPAAPEGFELIPCRATPRHWPTYAVTDDDFYGPGGCPACDWADLYESHRLCEHSHHRTWRRWKISHRIATWLYTSGLAVSGGGTSYGNGCNGCMTSLPRFRRGERPYVLFVKWETWRCILKGHHTPGDPIAFGYCSKCLPCPDCGSKTAGHEDGCSS